MFVKLPLLFSHRASHREIKLLLSRWSRDSDNLLSQERNNKAVRSVSPVVYCLSFLCTRPRRVCLIINGRITGLSDEKYLGAVGDSGESVPRGACWRLESAIRFADGRDRSAGVRRVLSWREDRICADFPTASSFSSLAAQLDFAGSASPDARPHLVGATAGCISGASGGAAAKQRSAHDDSVLVH